MPVIAYTGQDLTHLDHRSKNRQKSLQVQDNSVISKIHGRI